MRIFSCITVALVSITCMPAHAQVGVGDIFKQVDREAAAIAQRAVEQMVTSAKESWSSSGGVDDRSSVQAYARESSTGKYVVQGILIGAAAGIGANCVKNATTGGKCLDNAGTVALLGGALGAAGGWFIASKNREYESEAKANEAQLNSARFELEQAQQARASADRLVEKRSTQLKLAADEARKNRKKKADLDLAIADARADRVSIDKAIARLDGEKRAIQTHLTTVKNQSARREYEKIAIDLEAEKKALEAQLAELDGSIAIAASV